jgi:iron transport multicopper oxidase
MVETNLHPLSNTGVPGLPVQGGADVNVNLALEFNFSSLMYTVNGVTFAPPTVPVLLQILSGARTAQELLPKGSVYTLPRNKVIEISIPEISTGAPVSPYLPIWRKYTDASQHPFHMHGVRSASSCDNILNWFCVRSICLMLSEVQGVLITTTRTLYVL